MSNIYCAIPKEMQFKKPDPFNYKLRSPDEIREQMKYYPPKFTLFAEYKRYTAGDYREGHPNNTDDRDRVSKITGNLREFNLAPLQRKRFIFLLGPRWDPKKPNHVKIVTKQYPTFLENYFKGMETIKELYWEALRAPTDRVDFKADPYLKQKYMWRNFGRTKEERDKNKRKLAKMIKNHKAEVDARIKREEE